MNRKTNITINVDGVVHRLVEDGEKELRCSKKCSLAKKCFSLEGHEIICGYMIESKLVPPGLYHFEREEVNHG